MGAEQFTSRDKSVGQPPKVTTTAAQASPARRAWPYAVAALLALVGLADALYLTIKHLTGAGVQCSLTTGCEEVLNSSYATVGPVPLAGLGAAAYFAAFSLATLVAFGYSAARLPLRLLVALMLLVSIYLLYVQQFVIGRFCQFCLLSAAVTLCLAFVVFLVAPRAVKRLI